MANTFRLLIAGATIVSGYACALEIKGLRPDMPLGEAKAAIGVDAFMGQCRQGVANSPQWSCYYNPKFVPSQIPRVGVFETYANRPATTWLLTHDGERLTGVNVQFDVKNFDHVLAALTERWGRPSSIENSTIQNRAGASFDQVEAKWLSAGSVMTFKKRSGRVDESRLMLSSERAMKDFSQQKADQAKEAAKDM